MSGLRNTIKGGWHPEGKEGGKESWRGDFKGINQVAGWMGKGKEGSSSSSGQGSSSQGGIRGQVAGWMGKGNESNSDRSNHVSQPLSALKDPSAFGPPPKHAKYHGAAAAPNQANVQDPHRQEGAEAEEEQFRKPAPPPVPYRVNTSGLSTDNLPPPPVRRLDSASSASTSSISKSKPPKPPPRLPARNGSPISDAPPAYSPAPVLSHDYINQDATSRLANAGVSVPGFGIGQEKSSSPAHTPVNELQSRFSQMNTSGSPSVPTPPVQASANIDPQSASSTSSVQNFRERHAGTIDSGKQKYGDFRERHADTIDSGKQKYGDFRERHADTIDSGKQKYGDFRERHADTIDSGKQKYGDFRERHADTIDSGKQKYGDFRERHADTIDSGKQKYGDFRERHADTIDSGKQKYGDFRERHADTIDSGKQKYGDFRERHADSIDSGKQKLSGYASRFTGSSPAAPTPPARPASNTSTSMNLEPAEPARGTSSVQDFRERHADKIDMGKEKWGGVTSRFNTFVEDRKFSAEANKRVPRPPSRPVSMAQSNSAAGSPTEPDIQSQAQRKKAPPPPPPKRAEFRASPVDASSPSPLGPPPVPHNTKPR